MFEFAQTNLQLYAQLAHSGHSHATLARVFACHELAMWLFAGQYRPNGKLFLAHLIGTASVLDAAHAPESVIVAGLLHAAYTHGDFGDGRPGITHAKRARVRKIVGELCERRIADYTQETWSAESLAALCQRAENVSEDERALLGMRLANDIDDHLDGGLAYCGKRAGLYAGSGAAAACDAARQLGLPQLAALLEDSDRRLKGVAPIPELQRADAVSFVIAPASFSRRLGARIRGRIRQLAVGLRAT